MSKTNNFFDLLIYIIVFLFTKIGSDAGSVLGRGADFL